ncbi:response regulator transcription factor [Candidatus Atelocyanobacterium thalassae]|uniref:Two component transcriptional regulator, LuxR family n=2 Tax=Candidatus Atelocyanobacterium thalassae TaxID=713887 RepID=A0A086CI55_9CHRO|nr:response regulator transcription factor [Candidatus Atelocyanobacterium thalassa]KFF41869.1 MAG: two component transcriptional regulator, LuxR family [Candidatus Atelocyanobacterium thalassa isolate SIO64986]BDA40304.1 regulator of RpoS [cyanobacterium endosymbiont of Braarudosphaera bigelowii]
MSNSPIILLVDDEPSICESVQTYLEYDGKLTVKIANNAKEAWKLLEIMVPDIIISDVMMPEIDGYQFLEKIRHNIRLQTIPLIFLTARGMTADRIKGYNAGCDVYLPKPFDPEELEAIVKSFLERRKINGKIGSDSIKLEEIAQEIKGLKEQLGQQKTHLTVIPPHIKIDLTPREKSVLDLVAEGLMNKEIAARLNTSVRNVEKYVSRLFGKTETNSRTELVRFALKHGLTQ